MAWFPNQIKSIDNLNPTDDPDIRFSMDETFSIDENGNVLLNNADSLSTADWDKISKSFKRLGYNIKGAEDAKTIFSRTKPKP